MGKSVDQQMREQLFKLTGQNFEPNGVKDGEYMSKESLVDGKYTKGKDGYYSLEIKGAHNALDLGRFLIDPNFDNPQKVPDGSYFGEKAGVEAGKKLGESTISNEQRQAAEQLGNEAGNKLAVALTEEKTKTLFVKVKLPEQAPALAASGPQTDGAALGAKAGLEAGAAFGMASTAPIQQVGSVVSPELKHMAIEILKINNISDKGVVIGTGSYKVAGETKISILAKDESNNLHTIAFRKDNYTIYSESNEGIMSPAISGKSNIQNLKQYSPDAPEMLKLRSNDADYGKKVTNPTPLQTIIMYTELENNLKPKFAKDPYSIGKFKGYVCPAGEETCGFGSTGKEYSKSMSVDTAFSRMNDHMDYQTADIRGQLGSKYFDALRPREQDTLTSLGYNAGRIGNGLVTKIRNYVDDPSPENDKAATDKIKEYCKYKNPRTGKHEVLSGLSRRRDLEVKLWQGDIDGIPSKTFHWLGTPEAKTREQFKEYCNGIGSHSNENNAVKNEPPENLKPTAQVDENMHKSLQQFDEYKNSGAEKPADAQSLMASLPKPEISAESQGRA